MTAQDVLIFPVPLPMLGKAWNKVAPLLLRGLVESPNISLKEAVDDLLDGTDTLWVIFSGGKLEGVFLTHAFEDERGKAVDIYALSGRGLLKWGKPLSRVMVDYAKQQGCSRIVFCGRKGSERAYEGVRIVGELKPGIYHFEREVAP